jgi:phosphoribosyl 1,2-cyclic phosphodiesterase
MLRAGRYPYELKKRIMSRRGHLSNDDAGMVATELARTGTHQIILAHLSKENNFPELAMRSCELSLQMNGIEPHQDVLIYVSNRDRNSGMFSVTAGFE